MKRPPGVPDDYGPTGVQMTTGEEVYRQFDTFQTPSRHGSARRRRG